MAKVLFKRYETDTEAQNADVVDGQFIVTKDGTSYIDYGEDRVAFGGLSYNEVFNFLYPVGSYYETSNTSFDPNVTWGGTWVLETDGTVLASSSSTIGSIFNNTIGTIVGSETHTLTTGELPNNTISTATAGSNADGYIMRGGYTSTGTYNIGGQGQAHNIVQPTKIVNRWHRTA